MTQGGTARHRTIVGWAGQNTNNPIRDPLGPTYGSGSWGSIPSDRAKRLMLEGRRPRTGITELTHPPGIGHNRWRVARTAGDAGILNPSQRLTR